MNDHDVLPVRLPLTREDMSSPRLIPSQPLRVLLACHRFPPDGLGGIQRITQALGSELAQRGNKVGIVTRQPGPPASPTNPPGLVRGRLPDGTALYRLSGSSKPPMHFLSQDPLLAQLLTTVMAEESPEVVHILNLMHLSPRLVEIAHRLPAAVVISLQDYYFACHRTTLIQPSGKECQGPQGGSECARTCFAGTSAEAELLWELRTLYFRRLLFTAQRVICPSQFVATFFERFGLAMDRVRIIPNAISIPRADPLSAAFYSTPAKRGALRIAVIGTVGSHKGQHGVLDALQIANLPSVALYLFGQTDYYPEYVHYLRERAKALHGLQLCIYGKYEPEDLPLLLDDMDCVIAPSLFPETFNIAVREALARGIPVFVSRLGALPEAIIEGENGFTFDPRRLEELALLLQRLAEDEGLLLHLRQGARQTPVMTQAEHAEAVQGVYLEAREDLLCQGPLKPDVLEELEFLNSALLKTKFAATPPLST